MRGWVEEKPTYVIFNNDVMKEDALRFLEMTKGGKRRSPLTFVANWVF